MCGIAGFLSDKKTETDLVKMLAAIEHRGPDHEGSFFRSGVGLGNRRLKIIDLAGGNQPIFDESGENLIVYNGEVYNFQKLRTRLENLGVRFKTHSDTEVILHQYLRFGINGILELDGMFAFAIYNIPKGELVIFRDRAGIKPLYYTNEGKQFYFSSELNSLLVAKDGANQPDALGMALFLHRNFIAQPYSAVKDVKKLPPGAFLKVNVSNGQPEVQPYYVRNRTKTIDMSHDEAIEQTIFHLRKSVHEQLVSEVPVGVFLSSGLDSCAILAMAQEHIPPDKLGAYTLSFNEAATDEGAEASLWAKHFGVNHRSITMTKNDLIEGYENRMDGFGEPLGGWINLGQTLLAKVAEKDGFKVMLGGAGGDELFCGYPTLQAAVFSSYLPRSLVRGLSSLPLSLIGQGTGNFSWQFKLKSLLSAQNSDILRTYFDFRRQWDEKSKAKMLTPAASSFLKGVDPFKVLEQHIVSGETELLEQLQIFDFNEFLESVLYGGDNAVMASSVEERVPFLSNEMIEFADKIPNNLKFDFWETKPILRESLKKYLSTSGAEYLVSRYKKKGFWLPVNAWMQDSTIQNWVRSELSEEKIKRVGFFNFNEVNAILMAQFKGKANYERQIQSIMGMNRFLLRNNFIFG